VVLTNGANTSSQITVETSLRDCGTDGNIPMVHRTSCTGDKICLRIKVPLQQVALWCTQTVGPRTQIMVKMQRLVKIVSRAVLVGFY
jgi:hypothetical protein